MLADFFCPNAACPDHGRKDRGNLAVHGLYGPQQTYRLLKCRTCKTRFSERKGTLFYRSHLSPAKVVSILEHLSEGYGVR